jgi:hypothetical protein
MAPRQPEYTRHERWRPRRKPSGTPGRDRNGFPIEGRRGSQQGRNDVFPAIRLALGYDLELWLVSTQAEEFTLYETVSIEPPLRIPVTLVWRRCNGRVMPKGPLVSLKD